ncbi:hypothetical protein [Kocuria atrinae]
MSRPMPPWRSNLMPAMLLAPTTIPATSAETFTAAFARPDSAP